MGTEQEIEHIADASDPGPQALLPDIERGEPPPAAAPPDIEAERARAQAAAALHVAHVRRAARRTSAPLPEWAASGIYEARYCAIDLETTGARAGGADDILEVGAVRVVDGEPAGEFASLVRPRRPITPAAQAVHGIREADVADAPPIEAVLPALLEMVRGCVLVFHNAPFDLGFLQRALAESDREPLVSPVVDTLVVARRLAGGACGLGKVAARLGVPGPHPHRALGDARLTAGLLAAFLDILRAAGAERLSDIPGIRARPPRARVRRGPPPDLLARRLEDAATRGEAVHIAYRLAGGMAPQELHVRPRTVQSGVCVALDLDRRVECVLDLARVDRLTSSR